MYAIVANTPYKIRVISCKKNEDKSKSINFQHIIALKVFTLKLHPYYLQLNKRNDLC